MWGACFLLMFFKVAKLFQQIAFSSVERSFFPLHFSLNPKNEKRGFLSLDLIKYWQKDLWLFVINTYDNTVFENDIKRFHWRAYFQNEDIWIFAPKILSTVTVLPISATKKKFTLKNNFRRENSNIRHFFMILKHCDKMTYEKSQKLVFFCINESWY